MTESTPTQPSVSEQMQVRLDKRARILAEGGPVPVTVRAPTRWRTCAGWGHLEPATRPTTSSAWSDIFLRNTGKLCFATWPTSSGRRPRAALR